MNPQKMTNEEMVMHLDLWLALDGTVQTETQKIFFEEVIMRLLMTTRIQEQEKN